MCNMNSQILNIYIYIYTNVYVWTSPGSTSQRDLLT